MNMSDPSQPLTGTDDYGHLLERDSQVVWHPYSSMLSGAPVYPVRSAAGCELTLANGQKLVDGMASWWCMIHGYNHPVLNEAIRSQLDDMAHVMFGGLTHGPAVDLAEQLVAMTPEGLDTVFFADSGSVAVEVAMKMAVQYWFARQRPEKQQFLTISKGYHGDTLGAMSVCDPVTGMHTLFRDILSRQLFAPRPNVRFDQEWDPCDIEGFKDLLHAHHESIAAVILEPIVQGAGGMWFYHPRYLETVRQLCNEYDVLLIADEIATGFGRSGRLFACEYAGISPDIMCLGKAISGGYLSFAATLATRGLADTISAAEPGVFMHGPTFMANPLACAVSLANIRLLQSWDWQARVRELEQGITEGLLPCLDMPGVRDVRSLGAIGVVELEKPVDLGRISEEFVRQGVWIRPFGRLIYIMPPFVISDGQLQQLTSVIQNLVARIKDFQD